MNSSTGKSAPVLDPLCYGVDLPCQTVLYPLGFRMDLATNSQEVIQSAEQDWAGFPSLFDDRTLEIRVAVSNDHQAPCPTSLIWRAQRHLLALESDRHNFAVCDLEKGFSFCWIVPATARNHDFLQSFLLRILVQAPLWQTHLTWIHAACVARNGRALLLCGASGAGKSCLAYACARRGWTFITDEVSSLVRNSKDRMVLGNPRYMHFRDTAAAILPELNGRLAARNAVGKMSLAVRPADLGTIDTAFQSQVAAVVFLDRQDGRPARLTPVSPADAFHGLDSDLPLFPEPLHDAHRAALRALVGGGAFELRYHDLDEAVSLLEPLTR
ncbi:MAG: hypothetical protein LAP39_16460 [Acidobacteriia bacterium]|nr:hypothetical protein [Terriglobia bacterium]